MTGEIKRLQQDRGFGFIRPTGASEDVFFHSSALAGLVFDERREGQTVEFEKQPDERDSRKTCAVNVRVAVAASARTKIAMALPHQEQGRGSQMTTTATRLNRAYVQGTVIEANLEHLRVALLDANADLRDGLKPFTHRFGQYVRSLNDACIVADADERAGDTERRATTAQV